VSSSAATSPRPRGSDRLGTLLPSARRLGLMLLGVISLQLAALAAHAGCEAWPEEPALLPTVADPDPHRARWAALRIRELTELALAQEALAPVAAHRLWRRVLCFDETNPAARSGIERTFPIALHRPPVSVMESVTPELHSDVAGEAPQIHSWARNPWEELGHGLILYVEPPPLPPPPPPAKIEPIFDTLGRSEPDLKVAPEPEPEPAVVLEPEPEPEIDWAALAAERARALGDVEEQLDDAGDALRTARFRFGLIALDDVRLALGNLEDGDDLAPLRVQLETLAATAHVALGQKEQALESLLRVLEADPNFKLDPATTSPKVLLALRLARATRGLRVEGE